MKQLRTVLKKLLLVPFLSGALFAAAQSPQIRGTVLNEEGAPMEGVSVVALQNTTSVGATTTNKEGVFALGGLNLSVSYSLTFSYVGYDVFTERNVMVKDGMSALLIRMKKKDEKLDQVVVTALGISRQKRSLGYATQEVESKALNEAPASNFVNNLAGKVAGVQISAGGTVGASSRITIRGESSLSMQNNQPLFVIDGTPVANDGVNNTSGGADFGNSAAAINPADIESVNVLKGPAAAALYGSRAANGAIVITTKKGVSGKGNVSVNSYYYVTEVGRLPEFQNEFGGGNSGRYEGSNFGASWSPYPDGIYDSYDESWGPRLNQGTLEAQFDSPTTNGYRGADVSISNRGDIIPTPWISHPNNVRDFFDRGQKTYNNIAFSGSNDRGQYRLSLTALNEKGTVPNNDMDRYQVTLNSSYKISEKLTSRVRMNYANTGSSNRPDNGYGRNTVMYFFTWMNRDVNINGLRDYWQPGLKGIRQFQYNYGENHSNPFFLQYENTKGQHKNHVYGNADLNYAISKKMNFMVRTSLDYYNDFRPMKWAVSDVNNPDGRYEEVSLSFQERNTDFLLSYTDQAMDSDLDFKISVGGNRFDLEGKNSSTAISRLLIPGIYNIGNTNMPVIANGNRYQKRINSLYAMANLSYKNLFFLDITGRNDWSSTLPAGNNSYFYPSASLNTDLKRLLNISDAVSNGRLRFGWAQVGNDAGPYQLYNTYNYATPWGSNAALAGSSRLANANLKPEITSTYEIGTAWSFLSNRLSLDLTYYNIISRNQILELPQVTSSGFGGRAINAGKIRNRGLELILSATPVKSKDFKWDLSLNWARNVGTIVELSDEADKVVQAAPGENASIQARVGDRMGAIWGPGFMRVPDGKMKGDIIIYSNGRARATSEDIHLGNINPDWTAGMSNQFTYKNFSLYALISGQVGGKFVSRFYNKAVGSGMLIESLQGRAARPLNQEYAAPYYIQGAALMADGSYQPNNTSTDGTFSEGVYGTDVRNFFKGRMDHISEAQLFSTTYFKLRELSIGYNLPTSLLQRAYISNARISLTGRNLFLWTPNSNRHFDPEVSIATAGNGLIPGFENMSLPSYREYGVSLNLTF